MKSTSPAISALMSGPPPPVTVRSTLRPSWAKYPLASARYTGAVVSATTGKVILTLRGAWAWAGVEISMMSMASATSTQDRVLLEEGVIKAFSNCNGTTRMKRPLFPTATSCLTPSFLGTRTLLRG